MSCASVLAVAQAAASSHYQANLIGARLCAARQVGNPALPDAASHIARILALSEGAGSEAAVQGGGRDRTRRVRLSPQLAMNLGLHCHLAPFLSRRPVGALVALIWRRNPKLTAAFAL